MVGGSSPRLVAIGFLIPFAVGTAWVILSGQQGRSNDDAGMEHSVPVLLADYEAVVLDDVANRAFWGEADGEQTVRVQRWVGSLRLLGMDARTISDISEWQEELLVLPHSYCLSADDLARVEEGIEQGKGVLFAGPVGVRERDGSWVGWNRFHSLIGSSSLREFNEVETSFLVVSGTGPVGSLADAGYRISLPQRGGQWGVSGLPGAAYWADYLRKGFPADGEFSAAVMGSRAVGRFVWVGFEPDLPAAVEDNRLVFSRLVAELVTWAMAAPASEPDLYPAGLRSALMFVMDTEWGFQNASLLDAFLLSKGVRGGFMCVNELAVENSALVRSLARNHDIGSHSEDHSLFVGQSSRTQARRLRESASELSELAQQPIRGFRPPEEQYDENTVAALAKAGYSYMLGGEGAAVALPLIVDLPTDEETSGRVVLIPRIQRDDLYLANQEQLDNFEMSDALLEDWDTVVRHRGIHYVSVHSTFIDGPDKVSILDRFMGRVAVEETWLVGPDELADWWRRRSYVRTEIESGEQAAFLLSVINEGPDSLAQLGVWVSIPGNPTSISLSGERAMPLGPDERGAFLIQLDRLAPEETVILTVEVGGPSN